MNERAILLSMCIVLAAAARGAADADTEASRKLQNLVYYPHSGQWRVTGEFTGSLDDSGSTVNDLGTQTTSRSASYQKALLGVSYGVTDGLRLGITETGLFNQQTQSTNQNTGVTTVSDSNGFADPTMTIAKRLHDSTDEGLYADSALSLTPAIGHALAASGGQEGNDLAGAWSATASVPVYFRHRVAGFANELEAAPELSRSFGGLTSGPTLNSSTLTSSYWYGSILFQDRFHFNSSWFAQPGVSLNFPYSYETATQSPGAPDTARSVNTNASPSLAVGFLPTDRVLLEVSVTYSDKGSDSYPATGTGNSAQVDQTYATVQMHLAF